MALIVTLKELRDLGACPGGLRKFRKAFGASTRVTRRRLMRMREHAEWLVENHPLLGGRMREFVKAVGPAMRKFNDADSRLFLKHSRDSWTKGNDGSRKAYNMALRPHLDRLYKAEANALADLLGLE